MVTNQVVLESGVWQTHIGNFSFEACAAIFLDGFESGDLGEWGR